MNTLVKEVQIKTTKKPYNVNLHITNPLIWTSYFSYTPLDLSNYVSFLEENHFVQLPDSGCCNFSDPVDRRAILSSMSEVGSIEPAVLVTNIQNMLEKSGEGF